MHPMMIVAMADEVARERRTEWECRRPRFLAFADGESAAARFQGLAAVRDAMGRIKAVILGLPAGLPNRRRGTRQLPRNLLNAGRRFPVDLDSRNAAR